MRSEFQQQVARELDTDHHELLVDDARIGELLPPEVVRLAEQPLVRSAPAPLLALSRLVRAQSMKVVSHGEGADEIFWGYQLFQETKIRRFWGPSATLEVALPADAQALPVPSSQPAEAGLLKQFYGIGFSNSAAVRIFALAPLVLDAPYMAFLCSAVHRRSAGTIRSRRCAPRFRPSSYAGGRWPRRSTSR